MEPLLQRVEKRHAPGGTHFCLLRRAEISLVAVPCFCCAGKNPLAKSRPLPLLRFGCFVRRTRLSFAVPNIPLLDKIER